MNFKEQLTAKANEFNVQKDIEYIKRQMKEFYYKCEYTISLIRPYTRMAIGSATTNHTSLFIPDNILPEEYCKLFIEAFQELGFTYEDITLKIESSKYCDSYDISLKW